MKDQAKFYRNKLRNDPEQPQERYVPNYQLMGIDPEELRSAQAGEVQSPAARGGARPLPVRIHRYVNQPYAETVESPIGPGNPVPNVGNNMEHTWASVDGEIVDDLDTDPNASAGFIDNNDYVTEKALTEPSFGNNVRNRSPFIQQALSHIDLFEEEKTPLAAPVFPAPPSDENLFSVVNELEPDSYLLLVGGNAICSGPLQEIEEETSALVLGNHELFDGTPVPEEKIIVLKKVKVKVGVFLG
jgi:hypothetical protein